MRWPHCDALAAETVSVALGSHGFRDAERRGGRPTKRADNVAFRHRKIKSITMPNFEARITSGATRAIWTDPPDGDLPTRINSDERRPHTFRQATVGVSVTISAIVNGVTAPLDAALSGQLFTWWIAECPIWPAPSMSSPGGQSSVTTFTPIHPGHYLAVCIRASGGRWLVPFEAVTP